MRISDWSSDVCSSDLITGVAVALDAPQAGALDGLDHGRLAETDEEGGPGLDADAVPHARAVGRQPLGVRRGVLGIGIGVEERQVRVRIVFLESLDMAGAPGHATLAPIGRASCRARGGQYMEISG